VENIVKNAIEDKIIGTKEQLKPKGGTGNAFKDVETDFAVWLQGVLDDVVSFKNFGIGK